MNRKKPQPDSEADGKWIQAFIFDLDGVITDTARAHARAWKQMFDDYLQTLGERRGTSYGARCERSSARESRERRCCAQRPPFL